MPLLIMILALTACYPDGINKRTVHPLSPANQNRQKTYVLYKGIPQQCQIIDTEHSKQCLECVVSKVNLLRCGKEFVANLCRYNQDQIRCMHREVLTVTNLSPPDETLFMQRLDSLLESILNIFNSREEYRDQMVFLADWRIYLETHSSTILNLKSADEVRSFVLDTSLPLPPRPEQNIQRRWETSLQIYLTARLAGELTPEISRNFLLNLLPDNENYAAIKKTMAQFSIDSLD